MEIDGKILSKPFKLNNSSKHSSIFVRMFKDILKHACFFLNINGRYLLYRIFVPF